ncbi:MAG: hypothetical protein CM15mP49_26490 [Actinomycetota bacterium]|nr:MAG: hypothetical protein CM15mP49_26490 [Actinomycetota bacterium]
MDRKLLSWVNDRNAEGIKPLEIAAAVAREAAKQKGLPSMVINQIFKYRNCSRT